MFLQRLSKINNTSDRHLKLVLDHHIKHFIAVRRSWNFAKRRV